MSPIGMRFMLPHLVRVHLRIRLRIFPVRSPFCQLKCMDAQAAANM